MLSKIKNYFYIKRIKGKLKGFGKNSYIGLPRRDVLGAEFVEIGNNVVIENGFRVAVYKEFRGKNFDFASIEIGDGTYINEFFTCLSSNKLTIGKNCIIASFVYIGNFNHDITNPKNGYNSVNTSINSKVIKIGDNVWIGEKSIILPGVDIGDNVIIGAGSVVTKNIPKNSMAVGNPARVVKVYNEQTSLWESVT